MKNSTRSEDARQEAAVFARYVARGRSVDTSILERYVQAVEYTQRPADGSDRVLQFARQRSWAIAPLDAATAILAPENALRKRLLLMSAVVECSILGNDLYGPIERPPIFILAILMRCGAAALKAIFGAVLLLWLRK